MPEIGRVCPHCQQSVTLSVEPGQTLRCTHCHEAWNSWPLDFTFQSCPFCRCQQLYRQQDFNPRLGCLLVLIAAVLVPWTYGLSLVALFGVDRFLRPRVPQVVTCYQCRSLFRGWIIPESFREFEHAVGIRYDKFLDSKFSGSDEEEGGKTNPRKP